MTQFVIANNVNTQLAAAAASGATTLTLASSANLPTLSAGQIMPLTLNDAATGQNYEIVYVTAILGVTLTVTRAQEGTGALNWSIGDYAYCAPTAGTVAMTTGNPNNTFQVAAATAANQASQLGQLQAAGATYAQDTGSANTLVVSLSPAIASLSSGMKVRIHVAANNTGASTLNLNGLGALPIYGFAGSALQGGELKSGVVAEFCLSDDKTTWVLQSCEFGALQIAPATQSQHAVQLGQVAVFGSARNLKASLAAAGTSLTFTADAIVVKSALNGISTLLTSYSETLNIATTGAGGMDTGSAPASGYVAVYASWGAVPGAGIFAQDATSAVAPEQYGGTHAPSGVTETQLIGVWSTNGSGQLVVGYQEDRRMVLTLTTALSTSTPQGSLTSFSISGVIPKNAKSIIGTANAQVSNGTNHGLTLAASAAGVGEQVVQSGTTTGNLSQVVGNYFLSLITPQIIYYAYTATGGSSNSATIYVSAYDF